MPSCWDTMAPSGFCHWILLYLLDSIRQSYWHPALALAIKCSSGSSSLSTPGPGFLSSGGLISKSIHGSIRDTYGSPVPDTTGTGWLEMAFFLILGELTNITQFILATPSHL